jgi:capsid protein
VVCRRIKIKQITMAQLKHKKNVWRRIVDAITGTASPAPQAFTGGGSYTHLFSVGYGGEKNLGELGPIREYWPHYEELRIRSWQAYLESEIAKTVIDKFVLWMVSKGLRLQASPNKIALQTEGISINAEAFNDVVEARFDVWAKSRHCAYNGHDNLATLAREAFKNSKVGGDVLVILRYIKGTLKIQLIDGAHVCSPGLGSDWWPLVKENGNIVRNGVETTAEGEPVAYYVRTNALKHERIRARSASSGLITAFLVYGNRYRLDNHRGIPLISTTLETLKKLERYKEAAVGSAEERAKIVYQIIHNRDSTGESPLAKSLARAMDASGTADLPTDIDGRELANTVAATTNKSVFNMPIGGEMKALGSQNELLFKEFYQTNSDIICSAVGIPPNVAFSIYNDSFSASRAATKDWEHTITVNREDFAFQFYQPIYAFWLYTEVLANKVNAPGFLGAYRSNNYMAVEAYLSARFTGPMFPHIDPLKEVKAEREKLGGLGRNLPLTNLEQATEALNGGDSDSNIEQFADELKIADALGIPKSERLNAAPVSEQAD